MKDLSRREFLKLAVGAGAGAALVAAGCGGGESSSKAKPSLAATPHPASAKPAPSKSPSFKAPGMTVVKGPDPAKITRAAVEGLGGMSRVVAKGDDVVVKPNICTDYHGPEYAATTNPAVVATLAKMAVEAGAKRVRVMEQSFGGTAANAYQVSGIAPAVEQAGGTMVIMSPVDFRDASIPKGRDITSWPFYSGILDADVVINVPIAKNHGAAVLTLGCKNYMGVIANPNLIHQNLMQRIADLISARVPDLTVLDAVRILTANGPTGGNLADVKKLDTVVASPDVVSVDAYACGFFGLTPAQVPYIAYATDLGVGTMNLEKVTIDKIQV
jgi:uncharacterized protein (DUF362 family)